MRRRDLERLQQQPAKRGAAAAPAAPLALLDALKIGDPRDLGSLVVGVLTFLFFYHTERTVVRVSLRATRRAFAWAAGVGEPAWLK